MKQNNKMIPMFGVKVKKRLIELNMTQRHLAKEIGMNENYLTEVLNGRRTGKKYRAAIMTYLNLENDVTVEISSLRKVM